MKRYFPLVLAVALLAAPALAQMGVKQSIERTLQKAQEDHEENINQIENSQPQAQQADPKQNAAADAGWMEVTAKDINSTKVRFYVAHPNYAHYGPTPNLPALVVVQEYWGVNDDVIQQTEALAAKGYYAMAVDLYDGQIAKSMDEAEKMEKKMTHASAQLRLKTGLNFLMNEVAKRTVDQSKIGVLGLGLGGTEAMILATTDPRIKATVVFYGDVITDPAKLQSLKGPFLGIFGNQDPATNSYTLDKFTTALDTTKIPHEIHRYDGAGRGFAMHSGSQIGVYREDQAKDAWTKTDAWLTTNLVKPPAAPTTAPAN